MKRLPLLIILVVAIAIKLFYTQTRSYFSNCDELITVKTASGILEYRIPVNKAFHSSELLDKSLDVRLKDCAMGGDNGNSYVFNLVLSYWTDLFGLSNFAFRCFTTLCDCLSIIFIFLIGESLGFKRSSVIISASLLALNPIFMHFGGGFIRTYTFTAMLCLLSFLFFVKAYQHPNKLNYFIGFSLSLIGMFFGHFLSYYIFFAYLLFICIKRKESMIFFKRSFLTLVLSGCVCLGGLWLNKDGFADMKRINDGLKERALASQVAETEASQFNTKTITLSTFQYVLSFYMGSFSLVAFAKALGLSIIPLICFITFLVFPIFTFIVQYKEIVKVRSIFLLWLFVLTANFSAIGLMFVSKHFTPLDPKYTMFCIPFFLLLITQLDFSKLYHKVFLGLYCLMVVISAKGTFNRNVTRDYNVEIKEWNKKFITAESSEIKQYFIRRLKDVKPTDVLKFNNMDNYTYLLLLTNGKLDNACVIDPSSPYGLTIIGPGKTDYVDFDYYGDC